MRLPLSGHCAHQVEDRGARLRKRVVANIFPHLAQGFLTDWKDRLGLAEAPTKQELDDLSQATILFLYRLLFLLYAEGRELLPIQDSGYHAISLQQLVQEIAMDAGTTEAAVPGRLEKAYSPKRTKFYDRIMHLCRVIAQGDPVLNVPHYGCGLFRTAPEGPDCPEQRIAAFLLQHKVADGSLAIALDGLVREPDETNFTAVFLDYRSLNVRHLGDIYEGLLDLDLKIAEAGDELRAFLSYTTANRKASGSYYTPTPIIEYIVANTVGPVLEQRLRSIASTLIPAPPAHELLEHVLDLKVLDPAMGSGHFLVATADYITNRLLELLQSLAPIWLTADADHNYLKRLVIKHCLEGVDVDPMAVELAKVSLWLLSANAGTPLTFLDDNLRCGNSLLETAAARYDVVLGNPPYDVLAQKELDADLSNFLSYCRRQEVFQPACSGKLNLYKLFLCHGVSVLKPAGQLGQIVPMALLGDIQAAGVRRFLLNQTSLVAVEAFPQKDDRNNRVFVDAKLSTCVVITARTTDDVRFRARAHPGKSIDESSPAVLMCRDAVRLYDPTNQPILTCGQEDWDLAVKVLGSGRMKRLGELATAHQGEVNEKTDRDRGHISPCPGDGPLVLRGANVCMYALRSASQGDRIYVRQERFLSGRSPRSKVWHFRQARVTFQRNAPQNNFRRLIACLVPAGCFCCDTISYFPERESSLPLLVLIALFNSKLLDWFFRLGSTNSKVNDYQVRNLPVPNFDLTVGAPPAPPELVPLAAQGCVEGALEVVEPLLVRPPFSAVVMTSLAQLVETIIRIEGGRGGISRSQRSALDHRAQPYQDLLDRMLYRMAGISDAEAVGLERRLATML
jgi:hypothetical protein